MNILSYPYPIQLPVEVGYGNLVFPVTNCSEYMDLVVEETVTERGSRKPPHDGEESSNPLAHDYPRHWDSNL